MPEYSAYATPGEHLRPSLRDVGLDRARRTRNRLIRVQDVTVAQSVTDEDLLHRIAHARDRDAFAELFSRWSGRIRGAMINLGSTQEEADELTQEALLAVWRRAESYDPARAPAKAWIFTIARNRRIDMLRRVMRPAPDPEDPLFQPDPPAGPEEVFAERKRREQLFAAVSELSPNNARW